MTKCHLHFQRVEFFRDAGFGFGTHLLARPLLDAVELLVDIHFSGGMPGSFVRCMFVCFGELWVVMVVVVVKVVVKREKVLGGGRRTDI